MSAVGAVPIWVLLERTQTVAGALTVVLPAPHPPKQPSSPHRDLVVYCRQGVCGKNGESASKTSSDRKSSAPTARSSSIPIA